MKGELDFKTVEKAIQKLRETGPNTPGFTYFMPSPTEGKRILIQGWLGPAEAAQMVADIWHGEKTVDDFNCIEEIDQEIDIENYEGYCMEYDFTSDVDTMINTYLLQGR